MNKLTIILLISVILASCSTTRHNNRTVYSPTFDGERQTESSDYLIDGNIEQEDEIQQRIVIYNATISIVIKNSDSTNIRLTEIANKYNGYVQTLGNKKSIIRVEADKLNNSVTDISGLGKVKGKTIAGDDVTDQYTDFEIRLENAYKARERYLELLAKAENVEAALKVEKELERLNGEIDSLEGKLKRLKHLSEYSTVTVYMEEKIKPGILGYIGLGLYKSVKWLIVRN